MTVGELKKQLEEKKGSRRLSSMYKSFWITKCLLYDRQNRT